MDDILAWMSPTVNISTIANARTWPFEPIGTNDY